MRTKPKDLPTPQTQEYVKARLKEEGREARNLIAYSLPLYDSSSSSSCSSVDLLTDTTTKSSPNINKPCKTHHRNNVATKISKTSRKSNLVAKITKHSKSSDGMKPLFINTSSSSDLLSVAGSASIASSADSALMPPPPPPTVSSSLLSPSFRGISPHSAWTDAHDDGSLSRRGSEKQEKRSRSVSAGRNPQQCLRARHWAFLFRNLQQAVDQIYQTCETDESVIECREAILMLERYTKDFRKLIEWLKIKWEYENTPPPQRPTSLTWEIRTASRTRETRPLTLKDVRRALNFDQIKQSGIARTGCGDVLPSLAESMKRQLAAELAGDLTLSNRLSLAARVERALSDRDARLESTLSALVEVGQSPEECSNKTMLASDVKECDDLEESDVNATAKEKDNLQENNSNVTAKGKDNHEENNINDTDNGNAKNSSERNHLSGDSNSSQKKSIQEDLICSTDTRKEPLVGKNSSIHAKSMTASASSKLVQTKKTLLVSKSAKPCISSSGSSVESLTDTKKSTSGKKSKEPLRSSISSKSVANNAVQSPIIAVQKAGHDDGISHKSGDDKQNINGQFHPEKSKTFAPESTSLPICPDKSSQTAAVSLKKCQNVNKNNTEPNGHKDLQINSLNYIDIKENITSSKENINERSNHDADTTNKKLDKELSHGSPKSNPSSKEQCEITSSSSGGLHKKDVDIKSDSKSCNQSGKVSSLVDENPSNATKKFSDFATASKAATRAPTVTMNKAWQVRQAFNQSRTPVRAAAPSPGSVGVDGPRCSAPPPWLTGPATASHSIHRVSSDRQTGVNQQQQQHSVHAKTKTILMSGVGGRGNGSSSRRGSSQCSGGNMSSGNSNSGNALVRRIGGNSGQHPRPTTAVSSGAACYTPASMVRSHTTLGTVGGEHPNHSTSSSRGRHSLGNEDSVTRAGAGGSSGGVDSRQQQQSWADKVRGPVSTAPTTPSSTASSTSLISSQAEESVCGSENTSAAAAADGGEGWEVVRRGRRSHGGSTASLNKNNNNNNTALVPLARTERSQNWLRRRYDVPSSATSMPSLAALAVGANNDRTCATSHTINTSTNTDRINAGNSEGHDSDIESKSSDKKRLARRSTGDRQPVVVLDSVDCTRRVSLDSSVSIASSITEKIDLAENKFELLNNSMKVPSHTEKDIESESVITKMHRSKSSIETNPSKSSPEKKSVLILSGSKGDVKKSASAEALGSSGSRLQTKPNLSSKIVPKNRSTENNKHVENKKDAISSKNKLDPKKFISRGKSSSDISLEASRKVMENNSSNILSDTGNSSDNKSLINADKSSTSIRSPEKNKKSVTKRSSSLPLTGLENSSREDPSFEGIESFSHGDLSSVDCSLSSSRYGAIMAEVHEVDEVDTLLDDDEGVKGSGTSATAPRSDNSSVEADHCDDSKPGRRVEGILNSTALAPSDLTQYLAADESRSLAIPEEEEDLEEAAEEDMEEAADEEEIRHNAAAFESAVLEEQRLKQQIHVTENTDIAAQVVQEDDVVSDEAYESHVSQQLQDTSAAGSLCHETPVGPVAALPSGGGEDGATPRGAEERTAGRPSVIIEEESSVEDDSKAILEMFATLDWSEEVCDSSSSRGVLESARLREPGRVLQIHEKLSSPARKLPLHEKLRLHKERLAKAEMLRQALIKTKTEKLKELFRKIEEVSVDKERLLDEKRQLLERKMERAEEKRRQHLQCIVAKAHDEDNKGREIAFINGLEAQNKLHDLIQQHQIHSSRLADMAEERCRRQEEKAAKEAAALERRRALEAERQARLLQLCEKRRERCERIDRQQAERREELLEQAREKARDRQERLNALVQAQQAKECELVRRIQQKQQESARRHEENIEQIKRRALESSILRCSRGCDDAPKIGRYERRKLCTLCHCLLNSEVYLLSHLRGSRHQDALRELLDAPHVSSEDTATYNLRHIVDAPDNFEDPQVTRDKERQKALKKRCRKIRSRMAGRARDYDGGYKAASAPQTQNSRRTARALHNISKLHSSQGTGPWSATEVAALDKSLLELLRILDKKDANEQAVFCALNGYENIIDLLQSLLLSSASSSAAEAVRNTKKKKSAKPINENDDKCDNNNKENTSRNESQKNIQNNSKRKNSKKSQQRLQSSENDTDELLSMVDSEASIASSNNTTPRCYVIPSKSAGLCSRVLFYSLAGNTKNSLHLLYSNLASVLVDWLILRLRDMTVEISSSSTAASGAPVHSPSVFTRLPSDPAVTHTLEVLAEVLCVVSEADLSTNNNELKEKSDTAGLRLQDLVSYCVCVGVADRVSWYLSHVQGPAPLDADPAVSELILAAMSLLSAMANTLLTRRSNNNSKEDPTQLLGTLQVTEACGVVSLLYGLLLHAGGRSSYLSPTSTFTSSPTPPALTNSSNASSATTTHSSNTSSSATSSATATPSPVHLQLEQVSSSVTVHSIDSSSGAEYTGAGVSSSCNTSQPPKLLPAIDAITIAATTLLRNLAMLNLGVFQGVLGSEGISLELRHVASFLLWYCSYWPSEPILHNIIALVGFLTVNNNENQCVVQTGETPTVLQQLCGLPWQYFSEPRLTAVLFPTLLACCTGSPHNTAILHTEMSAQVLEDYLRDEAESSSSPLLAILRQTKHQE